MRFADHNGVSHVFELEQHALDFGRVDLLAADIDDLRLASEDANKVAIYLDHVIGVEPPFLIEGAGRIEIAEHGGMRFDPEKAVDDLGFKALAANLDPERSRVARL